MNFAPSKITLAVSAALLALNLSSCAITSTTNTTNTANTAAPVTAKDASRMEMTKAIAAAHAAKEASAAPPKAAAATSAEARPAQNAASGGAAAGAVGSAPKPFAEVIKGAVEEEGFFTTWRKDDKVWLEIPDEMWDRPFFFSVNVTHSIGDSGLFGNHMGGYLTAERGQYLASFKKFGTNAVQLIARNAAQRADEHSPAAKMLARSFSDSMIGNAPIASAPHPTRKSVLIEANALLINDFPNAAAELERTYRQPYAFDGRNSSIERVPNSESETGLAVRAHYYLSRLQLPVLGAPPSPMPPPHLPNTLPEARSLFMGFYYGFSKPPATPMRPRASDPRVGYFSSTVADYTDPNTRDPRQRFINRWRLEKSDPNAALSEPKQPIVYWLDKNMPLAYRKTVTEGILEWNKAFELIGFKNAIVVKQQTEDDKFDTSASRFASVRWVVGGGIGFSARGPSKVDPRTGEILDADIEMNDASARLYSARISEDPPRPINGAMNGLIRGQGIDCSYADAKLNESVMALDLLVARGEMKYGSPQAEAWLMDAIKDTITHEVGHTLGLRHNFRASSTVKAEQLTDSKLGETMGISNSTMDYNPINIAIQGEPQGQYVMKTLGAYDKWAIEYGYQETSPETETAALAKTLSRANQPELAYATDEDAGLGNLLEGIDPEVNRMDSGPDPLAFYEKRFVVVHELWDRWQNKTLPDGMPYESLRRNFLRGFALIDQVAELATKYVGGVSVRRDAVGDGHAPLTPVDAAQQRRALDVLTKNLFEVDAFKFKPEFLSKLAPDFQARWDSIESDSVPGLTDLADFSVSDRVLAIQKKTLQQLMRDSVAARVLRAPEKLASPSSALSLAELYERIQKAVWSELAANAAPNISLMRRNLQREHVRLLADAITRPSARMPADARSLQREYVVELLSKLRVNALKKGLGIESRAHLNESIEVLGAALKAQVNKAVG